MPFGSLKVRDPNARGGSLKYVCLREREEEDGIVFKKSCSSKIERA